MTQRKYFAASHTAEGFINFADTNLAQIEHIFVLEHVSHHYKTAVLKQILQAVTPHHERIELLLSPFGAAYLEGFIIRDRSCAVITDTIAPENMTYTSIPLEEHTRESHQLIAKQTTQLYGSAYNYYGEGLKIHDELEHIYIQEMDFQKADAIIATFINDLLVNRLPAQSPKCTAQQFDRFLGTNTADGPINIVPHLIRDMSQRVYIKGRAGTGKSVFMKRVAQACHEKGFDLELYHCGFDPSSFDMVIVRELDFCIFDSTHPHAFSPERKSDRVIDLYEETVTPGTDETYATDIENVTQRYKAALKKGTEYIQQAVNNQDMIEQDYTVLEAQNVKNIAEDILKRMLLI